MKLKFLKNNFSIALNISLILVLAFVIWVLCLVVKNHRKYVEGHIVVTQEFLDSLTNIANLPPVIIRKDSIIHDTVWISQTHYPDPKPNDKDSTINNYKDSLKIKDQIDVSIKFSVKGTIQGGVDWLYKPIYKVATITIDRPKPYPVPYEVPVIKYRTGTYISFVGNNVGGKPFIGADIDFVTKKDYIWGLEYKKGLDGTNIYGFKVGFKLSNILKQFK